MKRLTTNRSWEEANEDLENELGYSHIWKRLNAIENILGDDYNLDRLRELVEADRDRRCAIVIRCCACKHYKDIDGMHWCNFWHMCCPNDSEFYCKAAK